MGRAKQTQRRRRLSQRVGMPPHRWLVTGADRHRAAFAVNLGREADAVVTAERINRLGGSVRIVRLEWSGPAAAYVDPADRYGQRYGDVE